MIPEFVKLSPGETELILKAPILVCILIAGADDHIDNREVKKAIKMAKGGPRKSQSNPLSGFYALIEEDFEDKLKVVMQSYPVDTAKRNALISSELSGLNRILPKLDRPFAVGFYKSIKELALGIAESSGGLLGIQSVGEEEARLVDLVMITDPNSYTK